MDNPSGLFNPIETLRLRLRCPRLEDATVVSEMMTPAVSRWLASWQMPFTIELAVKRITTAQKAASSGRAIPLVIERRQDGTPLGWIDVVRNQPDGRSATLGYWLGEAHQGHGYMREAAPAAVAAAFSLLNVEMIEAAAQPENAASFAVLRGCGMGPAGECTVFASARGREELCLRYEIKRTS